MVFCLKNEKGTYSGPGREFFSRDKKKKWGRGGEGTLIRKNPRLKFS